MSASGKIFRALLLPGVFLLASLGLGFGTQIVAAGKWHQNHAVHLQQVQALLHGRFAIGSNPSDLRMDLAWHDGSVQQVWGLGAPLLLVPTQMLAGLLPGGRYFPERLVFLLLLAGMGYGAGLALQGVVGRWQALAAGAAAIFFPPFLSLLLSRYQVWEETVAYLYVVMCFLFVGLVRLSVQPTGRMFLAVCLLAGFGPFVRPTAGFYSIATVLVALGVYRPGRFSPAGFFGITLVLLLTTALLITNAVRFGAPLEFGHSIHTNIYNLVDYTTTFENPFREATFAAAARDFLGAFVYTNIPGWKGFYAPDIFAGQAGVFRWHEFYFRVFDRTYLPVLGLAWSIPVFLWWRSTRGSPFAPLLRVIVVLEAWSIISFAGLLAFYLRTPGMSSRFLVDFAPSILAAIIGGMLFLTWQIAQQSGLARKLIPAGVLAAGGIWFLGEAAVTCQPGSHLASTSPKAVSRDEVDKTLAARNRPTRIPAAYLKGGPDDSGIPFNALGWNNVTGATSPYMVFFVTSPHSVRLVFAGGAPDSAYQPIGAKVGLETLAKIRETEENHRRTLVFAAPKNPQYQNGVQMLMVKTVPAGTLGKPDNSALTLVEVSWDDRKI